MNITFEVKTKEGWGIERAVIPPVFQLFSELIPVRITNLFIRPKRPVPSVLTSYEFTFTADAEFSITDILVITFPHEVNPWPTVTSSRVLQAAAVRKCVSITSAFRNLTCTRTSATKIRI